MTAPAPALRLGLSFGALYGDAAEMATHGAEAEAGGFDALWVPDSPMIYRDPYATLGALAGCTRRAALGTLATNPATRHPAVTASAILTVHELSGGRARLGLATGDSAVRRLGLAPTSAAELERTLRQLRALVRGEAAPDAGGAFRVRYAADGAGAPPVYVVASGPRVLEVAGRAADGVVLNVGVHPTVLRAAIGRVRAAAAAAGRDPDAVPVVVFAFCAVTHDGGEARARLKPSVSWLAQRFPAWADIAGVALDEPARAELRRFGEHYARYDLVHAAGWAQAMRDAAFLPDAFTDAFALGGSAVEVAARVRALRDLGVRELAIRPPSREDWVPTVRRFLADVVPALA